jgi:2-oxoglutarate ferredoxin oxidoreductase subunit gamma
MNHAAIMAGFGGQGILMIGNLLAVGALKQGLHVTFFPSYGVEMRGGTANCTVTISDREVGSPVTSRPQGVIAMNEPSVLRFGPNVIDGGTLLVNTSIAAADAHVRDEINVICIPCNDIARELGNDKLSSMVALGGYCTATGVISIDYLEQALPDVLPERAHKLIPKNIEALRAGASRVS